MGKLTKRSTLMTIYKHRNLVGVGMIAGLLTAVYVLLSIIF